MSGAGARPGRLVGAALRCYPARWRRRHGDEAAELAALLIRDGRPAAVIAVSYLAGAARAWLAPPPGSRRPLSTAATVLLAAACLLGCSAALLAETAPARAASTSRPATKPAPPASHSPAHPSAPHRPVGRPPARYRPAARPPASHSSAARPPRSQGTVHACSC